MMYLKTKHPGFGIFGGSWNAKLWYHFRTFGKFCMVLHVRNIHMLYQIDMLSLSAIAKHPQREPNLTLI
jgi:hypothetical protein